ncbi:MAG: TRAP transporter large permease subunit, partial [Pseudomonadota bacterium]|nr:TRAP transporter large permease subunit [Pseudomonadota bacterium]
YLVVPLMVPVIAHMEWDNIWIAVMLLINVNLALITPPMGGVLYVVSHIGNMSLGTVIKGALMPIIALIVVLLLTIFFPALALWLPGLT